MFSIMGIFILGYHKVNVNNEPKQFVYQTGRASRYWCLIRDIVFVIAKAEVSIKVAGIVATKQTPGIMTQLFGWFF